MWPPWTRVSHCFRVKADARLVIRASYSTSTKVNTNEAEHDTKKRSKYTENEIAQLRKLWQEGKTYAQIQSQVLNNRSSDAIKRKVYQLFGSANSRNSPWSLHQSPVTSEVKRDILTLHKDGLSVAAISRQLARGVNSVYVVLRDANLTPNESPKKSTRFTDIELRTLESWANRAVFVHEIAATFPHRTSHSVWSRLLRVRQELGIVRRVKLKQWTPAEDARLLGLAAGIAPHVSPKQSYIEIAPVIGATARSVSKRIWHLKRQERLGNSLIQGNTSGMKNKSPES